MILHVSGFLSLPTDLNLQLIVMTPYERQSLLDLHLYIMAINLLCLKAFPQFILLENSERTCVFLQQHVKVSVEASLNGLESFRRRNPGPYLCGRHIMLHTILDYIVQACSEGSALRPDQIETKLDIKKKKKKKRLKQLI